LFSNGTFLSKLDVDTFEVTRQFLDINQANQADGIMVRGLAFYQGDIIIATTPTLHDREFGLWRYNFDTVKQIEIEAGVKWNISCLSRFIQLLCRRSIGHGDLD
jgi:hypothetical protein